MPTPSCSTICDRESTQSYAQYTPDPAGHYANMGWVGFVNLDIPSLNANHILRVTGSDINLSQEIYPGVVLPQMIR